MNLQTHIRNSLWLAIQSTYEAKNYSHAILDAMHHLSNVLRERTGADGDGATLVGQALGGESPRLRINKLQTETERNEQKGMESMLRGLYQAIRNPRSHEQIEDKQETADAVIYFINYLLGIIEKSEEPFVVAKFLERIFDPHFYKSQQYAELLVNEIPVNKRFDVLISIYREKPRGDIYCVGLVVQALLNKLADEQVKEFIAIVSDELRTVTNEKEFMYNLHLLPSNLWEQLQEVSRLRAENRVIKELKEGEAVGTKCKHGALATWGRSHLRHFILKEQVSNTLVEKLESINPDARFYVVEYFLLQLPDLMPNSYRTQRCIKAICDSIRNGNIAIRNSLIDKFISLPENWQNDFVERLKDLIDENSVYLSNGVLFLNKLESYENEIEDDIPF